MGDERLEPLIDAALDRALDEALGVNPSGDFVARVRLHVAENATAGSRRHTTWLVAGLAAAAVFAVIALSDMRHPDTAPLSAVRLVTGTAAAPVVTPRAADAGLKPRRHTSPTGVDANAAARGRTPVAPVKHVREPQVLVAADETIAFRRLMAAANAGRLNEIPLPEPEIDADTGTIQSAPLWIAPIHVEAIELADEPGETR